MKTRRRDARLLALFCCLAVLPLAIWACTDAGDAPGGPTGPGTRYDPRMDQAGATIAASATNSVWAPGTIQGISAYFKDGNGLPVEGAPLVIFTEGNFSEPSFAFNTNPTLTDANGMASIKVGVPPDCPQDSYTFVVTTYPAGPSNMAFARGYVHVVVSGSGAPSGVTLSSTTTSTLEDQPVVFTVIADAPCADVVVEYTAIGAGLNVGWTNAPGVGSTRIFSVTPTSAGTLAVMARAACPGGPWAYSTQVNVTVTAVPVTVSAPVQPSGPTTLGVGLTGTYTTSGSVCSNGESVEYQFTASGVPTETNPTAWSSVASASYTWAVAGTYNVTAKARCSVTTASVSGSSPARAVTVGP